MNPNMTKNEVAARVGTDLSLTKNVVTATKANVFNM
jgi:hypothetical protein